MAIEAVHKETKFGVGDRVRIVQKIKEGSKTRSQTFEGMVIRIKGRGQNKSLTVRRVGTAQIGIERIYPLSSPTIEKIEVTRVGARGVRRAKLYYTRGESSREVEKIYSRAARRETAKKTVAKTKARKKST